MNLETVVSRRTAMTGGAMFTAAVVAEVVLPQNAIAQSYESATPAQEESIDVRIGRLREAGLGSFVAGYRAETEMYRKTGCSFPLLGPVRQRVFDVATGKMVKDSPELAQFVSAWGTKKETAKTDAVDRAKEFVYVLNQLRDDPVRVRQRIEMYGAKVPIGILACPHQPVEVLDMIFGRHVITTVAHEGVVDQSDPTRVHVGWASANGTAIPSIGSSEKRDAIAAWEKSTETTIHELGHQLDAALTDPNRLPDIQPYLSLDEVGLLYSSYQVKTQEALDAWLDAPEDEATGWGFLPYVSGNAGQDYSPEDEITAGKNQSVAAATGLVYDPDDGRSEDEIALSLVHKIWKKRAAGVFTGSEFADVTDMSQSVFSSLYHSTLTPYFDNDYPQTAHQKIRADLTKARLSVMAGDPALLHNPVNYLRAHLGLRPVGPQSIWSQDRLITMEKYDVTPSLGQYGSIRVDGEFEYATQKADVYRLPPGIFGDLSDEQDHVCFFLTNEGRKAKSGFVMRISGMQEQAIDQKLLSRIVRHGDALRNERAKRSKHEIDHQNVDERPLNFFHAVSKKRNISVRIDSVRRSPLHVGGSTGGDSAGYPMWKNNIVSPLSVDDGVRTLRWDTCRALVVQMDQRAVPVCFAHPDGSPEVDTPRGLLLPAYGGDLLVMETKQGFRTFTGMEMSAEAFTISAGMQYLTDKGLTVSDAQRFNRLLDSLHHYEHHVQIVPVWLGSRIAYQVAVTDLHGMTLETYRLMFADVDRNPVDPHPF